MIISNKKETIFLRRLFYLVCLGVAIGVLALFLLDYLIPALMVAGFFALWFLFFQFADFQFVEFSDADGKIVLRYHKVVHFGKISYHSIEFPQKILHHARFDGSVFGKLSDLTIVVKTRRGIADYPSVSLSALPKDKRIKIREALLRIAGI